MKTMMLARVSSFLTVAMLIGTAGIQAQTSGNKKQDPSSGEQMTMTGIISDSMCGVNHMAKNMSSADCLRMCVKKGTKYALVDGKNVYTLEGHEAELDKYAAQKVSLKGTVKGQTMTVESVSQTK